MAVQVLPAKEPADDSASAESPNKRAPKGKATSKPAFDVLSEISALLDKWQAGKWDDRPDRKSVV